MTDLPVKTDLTSGETTEAEFQSALGDLYDFLAQLAVGAVPQNVDIVDGLLEPNESCFIIADTENDTAADNLDNISPTNIGEKIIFLKITSTSRTITLRHMNGGSGQIYLAEEADLLIDHKNHMIALRYDDTADRWEEVWRSWGVVTPTTANKTAARSALGLGTAAVLNTGTGSGNIPLISHLGALAFLGALNSSTQLGDSIVTNAKLAGNIALSKLANNTANGLPYFNASGIPTVLPPSGAAGNKVLLDNFTWGNLEEGPIVIGQGGLNTSVGSVSLSIVGAGKVILGICGASSGSTSAAYINLTGYSPVASGGSLGTVMTGPSDLTTTLPGGQYGFYPNSRFFLASGAHPSCEATQRYVNSSPPYDLGDGQVGGFIFLKLNSQGEIIGTYNADAAPWIYNGPTKVTCDWKCPISKKKYTIIPETLTDEQILSGETPNYKLEEITQERQNRDMKIIPHPFGKLQPGETVVLLDPMDDRVRNVLRYQNEGGNIMDLVHRIKPDNEALKRKGPKGVMQVKFST